MFRVLSKRYNYNEVVIGFLFFYLGTVYFSIAIANIFLVLAIAVFLLGIVFKKIKLNFNKRNWYLYAFIIVPFILTLASALYSENHVKGLKYIWLRLPVLVVPILIIFIDLKTKTFKKGLSIFVILTIIASLITIYNALRYINEDVLFEPDFTFFITIIHHPYFGVFVLIAFVSVIEFELIKNNLLKRSVFILFTCAIALTTSRLVYLLFFLIVFIYLFKLFSKKKALLLGILLSLFTMAFILSNKSILTKFQTSIQYDNSPRLKLWNNAIKIINSSESEFLGIGIGDYYQDKKDVYFFRDSKNGTLGYNPHSQIVEFIVTNGALGLLMITTILIIGFITIIKQSRFAIIIFGVIVMFSLTESILSRQYGVQLYSVFIPLIFSKNFKR